jgi:hypothetical protein
LLPPELLVDCIVGNLSPQTGYRFDPSTGEYWAAPGAFDQGEHLVDRDRLSRQAALNELREMLALLDSAHVRHVEIVPPYSEGRLMQFDARDYVRWLHDVVAIAGSVWDFGDDNPVAQVASNYLDISHFDGAVGRSVLARVLGGPAGAEPPGFGVRVTMRNVTAHLSHVRLALIQARNREHLATVAASTAATLSQ